MMVVEPVSIGASPHDRRAHQRFLDGYYGWSRGLYDATRKYYLFGRDRLIAQLLGERWTRLVEIGPGTGRNLTKLHAARPGAHYGGIEAATPMLDLARRRCPYASLRHGFAEDSQYRGLLGAPPDRIVFSYTLSMVADPEAAIANARRTLASTGEVAVVDFGALEGLRGPLAPGLRAWLRAFHVTPLRVGLLERHARTIDEGPLGYYRIARIPAR